MTLNDLASRLSRALDIPRADALRIAREFFSSIVAGCLSVPRVEIRGFGTFSAVRRRARSVRDVRTGAPRLLPDRLVMKFKPSSALISAL